jgi:hypothetical protein
MKLLLTNAFILLSYFNSFCQQIVNVKGIQQGSKVSVSYDLNDQSGKPYYVKLLMSKDGGTTFGEELKYVSGDVKNTKAGISKKIIWDAAQEISYYDGNAVFRVEATLKAVPMPEPIELECSKVEITNVKGVGNRVTVDFLVTAITDAKSSQINNQKGYTSLYDISGNEFGPTGGKFGDTQLRTWKNVISGVPVKSQLYFDNISLESSAIPLLKIEVHSGSGIDGHCHTSDQQNKSFEFRNVPITR